MLDNDPLWYKDAIIYELHVKAFHDSVGDGMGNFRGLTDKIDYLQDLGITAIWLLPFYPSPFKDDGYDIADYSEVHPEFGKLQDFQDLLKAAHDRGIRVITELVLNHTSDQHPWFQRARRAPVGSVEREFYVWSDTPDKYPEARIIFKDFEHSNWTYDHVAKAYFWHRFYSHQPDLNYDNPAVWQAIFPLLDYWLEMGVDGMRLDALPYLYEREGTNCENLPETHQFIKALRKHVDERFPNRMFLAEANQWPEDAVAYFGNGDECQMAFHFPVMPRLFMAIHMEDRYPIIDILNQTPAIPENCQWGMFLRNHDELTLEMVTDEERDYMYRAYAADRRARINLGIRRRLAPLLGNNRSRIELMNGLLFSLPGTPVIYYGDEIGMGDNIYLGDRNGVRTPMQWSADRNAGFSRANPQKLYLPIIIDPEYHFEALNVEAQQNNPNSLLWWMKRLIALRKRHRAFGRGTLEFLHPANRKVLAFVRRYQDETVLVVANLSRFVQHVELDLSAYRGLTPVEMLGHTLFPAIDDRAYFLTLGANAFYWFSLEPRATTRGPAPVTAKNIPDLPVRVTWEELLQAPGKAVLEGVLPGLLEERPWFPGVASDIKSVTLQQSFRSQHSDAARVTTIIDVETRDGASEAYLLPLSFAPGTEGDELAAREPAGVIARVNGPQAGLLLDALYDPRYCAAVLEAITSGRRRYVGIGELAGITFAPFEPSAIADISTLHSTVSKEKRTSTSVIFDQKFVLKVFRRMEEGLNPDLEVGRYLATKTSFRDVSPLLGTLEFRPRRGEPVTLAVLHGYVPHQTNAWQHALDELSRYFERVLAMPSDQLIPGIAATPFEMMHAELPPLLHDLMGSYLESVRQLAERTAALHVALGKETDAPAFAPELYSSLYQRSVYQSLRNLHRKVFDRLRATLPDLPEPDQALAQEVLNQEDETLRRFRAIVARKVTGRRIRYHGDLHLGRMLYTGKDFVLIDFEGNPGRSITDRRIKRCALRDVASMLRSFHYVLWNALLEKESRRGQTPGVIRTEDRVVLDRWGKLWYAWVAATFLRTYLEHAGPGGFLPDSAEEIPRLLDVLLLEKAVSELGQELRHRLDWASIPLRGILDLLSGQN